MGDKSTPLMRKLMPPNKTDGETFGYYMITSGLLVIASGFGLNTKILIGIVLCVIGFKMTKQYAKGDRVETKTANKSN